jgi:DNA-binding LytR/AlgR family response regulator
MTLSARDRGLLTYAAIGGFLGLIGPFGTYLNHGGLAIRLFYWTGTSLISCFAFDRLFHLIAPYTWRIPRWALRLMTVIVATLPLSFAIHALALLLWPHLPRIGWLEWYGQALLVSAIYLVAKSLMPAARPVARAPGGPARLGHEVLCLQMEDHYVRVHSRDGSRLILNSLGRAMAELRAVDGMQVHRSWWVARHAVEALIEDGRNIRLRLTNGVEAPVSRTKIAALRAAGWL